MNTFTMLLYGFFPLFKHGKLLIYRDFLRPSQDLHNETTY